MHTYEARVFDLPSLEGISDQSVTEHIALYNGYVTNFNAMTALIEELAHDSEKNAHTLAEIVRRRSFEFGGMRLHEHYFSQFESGAQALNPESDLHVALTEQFGSIENVVAQLKGVAAMRGPGWSMLYYDPVAQQFHIGFTGEQHQGHFVTLPIIIALDVWEHAYVLDYGAGGKGSYVDAFFNNLNWHVPADRFSSVRGASQ